MSKLNELRKLTTISLTKENYEKLKRPYMHILAFSIKLKTINLTVRNAGEWLEGNSVCSECGETSK